MRLGQFDGIGDGVNLRRNGPAPAVRVSEIISMLAKAQLEDRKQAKQEVDAGKDSKYSRRRSRGDDGNREYPSALLAGVGSRVEEMIFQTPD